MRTLVAVVAFVATLVGLPVSQAESPATFTSQLGLQAPIIADGDVSIDPQTDLVMDWAAPGLAAAPRGHVITTGSASYHYIEESWQELAKPLVKTPTGSYEFSSAPGTVRDQQPQMVPHSILKSELSVVWDSAIQGPAHWFLMAHAKPTTEVRVQGTTCGLLPTPYAPTDRFHHADLAGHVLDSPGAPWVRASCDAGDFRVTGPFLAYFYNTTLEATLWKKVDGELQESRETIRTGLDVTTNKTNPLLLDYTERVLLVSALDEKAAFQPPVDLQDITVDAPAFGVIGDLAIPESTGFVQWGDWRAEPNIGPLEAQGLFTLTGAENNQVAINGVATHTLAAAVTASFSLPPAAVAIGLVMVAAVSLLAWSRARWFLAGLFTRLTQDTALEQNHRRLIVDVVDQRPGLREQEIVHLTGLNRGTVRYHLRVLCSQRLMVRRKVGGQTALFTKGKIMDEQKVQAHRQMSDPTVRTVLSSLQENPRQSQADIATRIHRDRSSVARILQRLVKLNIVQIVAGGRQRQYLVAQATPPPLANQLPAPVPVQADESAQ